MQLLFYFNHFNESYHFVLVNTVKYYMVLDIIFVSLNITILMYYEYNVSIYVHSIY